MSDKETSTLQSYVDKASGAAQSVLGSLTGSQADVKQGEQKKDIGDARKDVSNAGTTVGGVSVSSSGVAANDPDRQAGSWNQTIGSGKEFVGGALGMDDLKREGQQQNAEGKGQESKGQLNDLGSGVADRVQGTVGGAVAGLTGNRTEQAKYEQQHDQGKTLQRGVENELNK
ncbi:hypothetical protein CLAFUW4_01761 [Fulvia fulva]|uniref:CsbD-like domain-containing protein n=1 Tax=Passalora fulva TaxID=5499 RepID=A0A9Q8L7I8_PASFU|nr:uncharacterized protein CLAFUR5_01757 [Fulvia fulva]KAK4634132.1 hypothetical protein CLAFUR4_01759 [Fulvia fulva]KAK4636378.1 hypothetical protein CLAFUR0_01761 [Fulvia fulva]UJO12174.1 hypothetical protein CLAFUR5_01757 [Fulvia fulva]WPV10318.1 hypothetical protein CLAFUW4_01761 [Fulvia fulva]WPV24289.1 hypothetical protein CLAFUW7_01763 [Fulvia fulva]